MHHVSRKDLNTCTFPKFALFNPKTKAPSKETTTTMYILTLGLDEFVTKSKLKELVSEFVSERPRYDTSSSSSIEEYESMSTKGWGANFFCEDGIFILQPRLTLLCMCVNRKPLFYVLTRTKKMTTKNATYLYTFNLVTYSTMYMNIRNMRAFSTKNDIPRFTFLREQ